jgi:hypothetical protein
MVVWVAGGRSKCAKSCFAHTVATGQFAEGGALRAPPRFFLLLRCQLRRSMHLLPLGLGVAPAFGGTGAAQVAFNIGQAAE